MYLPISIDKLRQQMLNYSLFDTDKSGCNQSYELSVIKWKTVIEHYTLKFQNSNCYSH